MCILCKGVQIYIRCFTFVLRQRFDNVKKGMASEKMPCPYRVITRKPSIPLSAAVRRRPLRERLL